MKQDLLANEEPRNAAPAPGGKGAALKPLPEDALIVIPMRNNVLFPGVISPVTVGRAASVAAAQEAVRSEKRIGFVNFTVDAESEVALLSDASSCHALFGPPRVSTGTLIEWVATWVEKDLPTLGKPTHFETRDGAF